MDTSKKYIKMCEKAEEIQKIFKKKGLGENDFINRDKRDPRRKGFIIIIWLPRQDQLQDMLKQDYLTGFIYELYEFSKEYLYKDNGNTLRFQSMEQLWLAFVMKEKYGKIWGGKDWKKEASDVHK